MTKRELKKRTDENFYSTKEALQTFYDTLNSGQRKQIVKNEKVKALFDRYEVNKW